MGAWGAGTFDNDSAADFAGDFEEHDREGGLDAIREALDAVIEEEDYLDSGVAIDALVACEAIARLAGQGGEQSSYSETLDAWVAKFPGGVGKALAKRGLQVIERVMGPESELPELWEGGAEWLAAMADLKRRVAAAAA